MCLMFHVMSCCVGMLKVMGGMQKQLDEYAAREQVGQRERYYVTLTSPSFYKLHGLI